MSEMPLNTKNSTKANYGQVNNLIRRVQRESITKTYKQAGGNAIITGKLPYEGGYGTLYYDANGIPTIVIGILPDGTTGLVIAVDGTSVLDAFI